MTISSKVQKLVRLLKRDPDLALSRVWKQFSPVSNQGCRVRRVNGSVRFDFDFGLDPVQIKAMYWGAYEVWTLRMLQRLLSPGDTFINLGANIGHTWAYGASLVRPRGQVYSFQPVPRYTERLALLASLNLGHKLFINRCALGEQPGPPLLRSPSRQTWVGTRCSGFHK